MLLTGVDQNAVRVVSICRPGFHLLHQSLPFIPPFVFFITLILLFCTLMFGKYLCILVFIPLKVAA